MGLVYFWDARENAILRELYPDPAVAMPAIIAALLPRVLSAKAIYKHAGELGLKRLRSYPTPEPMIQDLINCRRARGWSQRFVATKLGVTNGYLRRIEMGQKKLGRPLLERWATLFGKRLGLVELERLEAPAKLRLMAGR